MDDAIGRDLEHHVGQGVQRRLDARAQGLYFFEGFLDRRVDQGAVQKAVGDEFVNVAQQVVEVGHLPVEREEHFAQHHDAGGQCQQEQARGAFAQRAAQEQAGGKPVQRDQEILEGNLEGRQAGGGIEGGRQPVQTKKNQPVAQTDASQRAQQQQ